METYETLTLSGSETDIAVAPGQIIEFVVNENEVVTMQNLSKIHDILFCYVNDLDRKWFVLAPGDFLKTDKKVFLRCNPQTYGSINLATDRS